ncbi:hypothetical protein Mal64_07120 [Pseudobythopirellula maris]|uniref:Uncharacterized protein n=1 Tax=Pseudobythopirellula maris TaxID=2527991 RepID=A0A5C5ZSX6_9BACT|nr:hypothetical protein [Pseudobythopirellula maris]TWT90326.1 hypothetical protein Mal64_07120 [Pseudobythopirellula maris]
MPSPSAFRITRRPPAGLLLGAALLGAAVPLATLGCSGEHGAADTTTNTTELAAQQEPSPQADTPLPAARTGPSTSVEADALLQRMAAAYRRAPSYLDNALYHERFVLRTEGVERETPPHVVSVLFERPNRMRIQRQVPGSGESSLAVGMVCDGERLRAFVSDCPGQLLDLEAPEGFQPTAEGIAPDRHLAAALAPVPVMNLYPQLDLLLAEEPDGPALLRDAEAEMLPPGAADGAPLERVRLRRAEGDYTLWIEPDSLLLRRLDMPTESVRDELDPERVLKSLELWIEFEQATFGARAPIDAYQMETPEGAEMVAAFEASSGRAAEQVATRPPIVDLESTSQDVSSLLDRVLQSQENSEND